MRRATVAVAFSVALTACGVARTVEAGDAGQPAWAGAWRSAPVVPGSSSR